MNHTFSNGEEPPDEAWVQDWTAWASAYQVWLRRRQQYQTMIQAFRTKTQTLVEMIEKTARHEPISVSAWVRTLRLHPVSTVSRHPFLDAGGGPARPLLLQVQNE